MANVRHVFLLDLFIQMPKTIKKELEFIMEHGIVLVVVYIPYSIQHSSQLVTNWFTNIKSIVLVLPHICAYTLKKSQFIKIYIYGQIG